MSIGLGNVAGIVLVLILIIGVGVYSGRKVSDHDDFATGGGKSSALMVCGTIMGALVSSQATIGTAQLAFTYGMVAWWFTLGSGIGCLILGVVYAIPLRHSGCTTLLEVISKEYGKKAEYAGSVLCSIGIFISVLAQVVACAGIISVIFPVSVPVAAAISVILMVVYVVFGGAWGVGMGGVVKLILLYAACGVSVLVILHSVGVIDLYQGIVTLLSGTKLGEVVGVCTAAEIKGRFLSLISRGAAKDIGSGISLLLGVLSTQTYAQAIWSGKSDRVAKRGSLLAAGLIPPIGIAGILIGMFMRTNYVTQAEADMLVSMGQAVPDGMGILESTIQVFPVFVAEYLPVVFAGVVLGTLLITVVGGGAGLSLGVATILVNDIYKKISSRFENAKASLVATRMTIVAVLAVAAVIACIVPSATINDFGFLSMGLRGAVVFAPVTFALFQKGKIKSSFVLAAIIAGPCGVLAGQLLGVSFDPLFIGVTASIVICLAGYRGKKRVA